MNAEEYQQLRQHRERWVSDDPRTNVIALLDAATTLFLAQETGDISDKGWDALYYVVDLIELLESAALRGGALEVPERLLQGEHDPVPELEGIHPYDLLTDLTDGKGTSFYTGSVAAFRYLHEELTAPPSGSHDV